MGQGRGIRVLGALGIGILLAGCVPLAGEVPGPSGDVQPSSQSSRPAGPAPAPEIMKLLPREGETIVYQASGYHGSASGNFWLEPGETFVSWTCEGFGPIGISFSNGEGRQAHCEDFRPDEVRRDSFWNESAQRLSINVDARERQLWQVLVTQKAR